MDSYRNRSDGFRIRHRALRPLSPRTRNRRLGDAEGTQELAGGDDGLDAVRTILARAAEFLNPEGLLVVEVGANRDATEAAFPRLPFTWLATPSSEDSVFLLRKEDLLAPQRVAA